MAFGKHGPMTGAEKKAAYDLRHAQIHERKCADPRRRSRLERDPAKWLRHYMPQAFALPWSDGHMEIIRGAVQAARSGTGVAVAAPRGEGKTTVLRGVCLYLVATGACRFPLMAGWTHKSASEGFRVWLRMLHGSPEFAADYPELCQPFELSTHSARLKHLHWQSDGRECGAEVRSVDRCIVLPDSRGAIAAASVQGDVKGLSVTLHDGTVVRPDLLLLDDAQDPKRAGDPVFVADTVETIEKQWMCLAGPQSRITTMVACTVAAKGDVSEHFLSRPDFRGVRVSRVVSWPDGWNDKNAPTRKMWEEWYSALLEGLHDGDGGAAGRKFYKARKAELTDGMAVSWKHRLDAKRKDPDALYAAMFDFFRIGEAAFASEYQNEPLQEGVTLYTLNPSVVQSRATDLPALAAPEWAHAIVATSDVNYSYGISTTIAAFGRDQRAHVMWYGVYDGRPLPVGKDEPPAVIARAVSEALVIVGRQLAAINLRIGAWIIDGGGTPQDTIINFCAASARVCGVQGITAFGRDAKGYKPYGKHKITVREQCHMVSERIGRQWLIWNADYWREAAQQGWTATPGMPGSLTLCAGQHREFAEQICREQLKGKADMGAGMRWEWHTQPGPHDYGDCMAMAYMGAAWVGIGTAGAMTRRRPPRETRKARIPMEA